MKNKRICLMLSLVVLFIFSGCSLDLKTDEPKIGKYVLQGAPVEDWAWVNLKENHQFEFNRNIATSYVPTGTYKVENHTLILSSSLNEVYYFTIDGDELILQGNKLTAELLDDKSVFKLTKMD